MRERHVSLPVAQVCRTWFQAHARLGHASVLTPRIVNAVGEELKFTKLSFTYGTENEIEGQKQAAATVAVDADLTKIQQLTREIQNIEAQISNNAPTVNNEMRARLTSLKSQRSDLIRQRQVRAYQQYSQSRRDGQAAAQTGGTGTQTVVDPLSGTQFGPQ